MCVAFLANFVVSAHLFSVSPFRGEGSSQFKNFLDTQAAEDNTWRCLASGQDLFQAQGDAGRKLKKPCLVPQLSML